MKGLPQWLNVKAEAAGEVGWLLKWQSRVNINTIVMSVVYTSSESYLGPTEGRP